MKTDFSNLLETLIHERFEGRRQFIEAAQPDANQAGALSYLSQVLTRKRPPPPDHLQAWADALGLRGAKREEFFLVAAFSHIPAQLRDRVGDLYDEVLRLRK